MSSSSALDIISDSTFLVMEMSKGRFPLSTSTTFPDSGSIFKPSQDSPCARRLDEKMCQPVELCTMTGRCRATCWSPQEKICHW